MAENESQMDILLVSSSTHHFAVGDHEDEFPVTWLLYKSCLLSTMSVYGQVYSCPGS